MDAFTESIQQLTHPGPDIQIRLLETFVILLLLGLARRVAVSAPGRLIPVSRWPIRRLFSRGFGPILRVFARNRVRGRG